MNGYILTGGRSTRMGRSKSAMFLEEIARTASAVFDHVIAVERHGGERTSIETIFEDEHEGEAPIFGVTRALQHCDGRCIVIATDYPLITTDLLRILRDAFYRTTAAALMPVWHDVVQPLCAGYSAELLPTLEQRIAQHRYQLYDLPAETIAIEGDALFNVNTPADLEEARRLR